MTYLLLAGSGVVLLFALARPQMILKKAQRQTEGAQILIALDVSKSMLADDAQEGSRLEIAKKVIREFVYGRQTDQIGLVIFSGEPVTVVPPTLDYNILVSQLDNVDTDTLEDGTAIGDGLGLSTKRLVDSKAKSKVIVLLTDGDNNRGKVDPLVAADLAAGYKIKVYTIALGKDGVTRIPFKARDMLGRSTTVYQGIETKINEQLLKSIAQKTGGSYYRAVGRFNDLKDVFDEIDHLEKSVFDKNELSLAEEHYERYALAALMLLVSSLVHGLFLKRVFP